MYLFLKCVDPGCAQGDIPEIWRKFAGLQSRPIIRQTLYLSRITATELIVDDGISAARPWMAQLSTAA